MNTITFTPDGNGHALYTEVIDLAAVGSLTIERATAVEFNHATQGWEVRDLHDQLMHTNPSRAACLAWEHQRFNQ
jgi:hypothetical protein